MSTHLVGQPLNETVILAMQCRHILSLKTMQNPVPMTTLVLIAADHDEDKVIVSAAALNRLEDEGVIRMVNFGRGYVVSLNASGLSGTYPSAAQCEKGASSSKSLAPDFSILHRPSILRPQEECSACGTMTPSRCECGLPVCSAHRYGTDGHHDPLGMCGKCYDEAVVYGGIQ